jgi:nicotinate phosphoribosyltransferase
MEQGELFTDLYELTMLQAYFEEGIEDEAVFDLHVRSLPPERNFLVACGLEQVLEYLERLSFSWRSLEHLESLHLFTKPFLDYLSRFRFTGTVRALPEGTIAFAREPLVEIAAPMPQAQLVETYVLNQVTYQTLIASKGARAVLAAEGRTLVDFGSRRAHGTDAALKAARALYVAGYASTSNVLAGAMFGIPVAGTMAHSYVEAHDSERAAFEAFLRSYPETVLLIDTYDTERGAKTVAELRPLSDRIRGVRLDSGDLEKLAKSVRLILDQAGLRSAGIFASGGIDERVIERLVRSGAPVTAFGVGTSAVVSSDAPALDTAYKLVEFGGRPRMKLSPEKETLPGKKKVARCIESGRMAGDTIGLAGEDVEGEDLLVEVMRGGARTEAGYSSLAQARQRAREQLGLLPPDLRGLGPAPVPYGVRLSPRLQALSAELRRRLAEGGQPQQPGARRSVGGAEP